MILRIFAKSEGCGDFTAKRFVKRNALQNLCLRPPAEVSFFSSKIKCFLKGSVCLKEDEQRKIIINFRVTKAEKKQLQEKAEQARMSLTDYILSLSENKKITVAENIPQLLLEITRIGTNINQIAHIGNSQRFVYREQLEEVIRLMNDVKSDMQKILSEIYKYDEHTFQSLEKKIDLLIGRIDRLEDKNGYL